MTARGRPLSPHGFQILLALADHDLHGFPITQEVFDRTGGRMQLWPGMLYGALRKMAGAGLAAPCCAASRTSWSSESAPACKIGTHPTRIGTSPEGGRS